MNAPCPPREQLEQLLDDRLEATEDCALARHVENCPECQARLERLLADGAPRTVTPVPAIPQELTDGLLDRLKQSGGRGGDTVQLRPGQLALKTGASSAGLFLPEVPGYEVLAEIGRGGMGVIYKARHLRLGRVVALKMILAGAHARSEDLRRFHIEASAVARLAHPGIVGVYDVGEHEGLPYLSLEFIEGGSLKQLLAGIPQPPRASARLVEQLAGAVQHAHEAGIVHRDLKPANVLLASDVAASFQLADSSSTPQLVDSSSASAPIGKLETCRHVKITDFGLAKLLTEGPSDGPTQSGTVVGTPGYMAPEQAAGNQRQVGPAADVYALGAILYECLTGRPPFQAATTLETLLQVMHDEPVSISRLQPRVPRDLATIAMRCLEKQPARRYASARDLADDLDRFLAGRPIHARRVGPLERGWRWCKRNPVVAGLASSLLVALVLGIAGVSWKWWEADQRRQEAEERRLEVARAEKDTARERDAAVKARREAQRSRAGVLLDKGVALAEQGEVAQGLFWMLESLVVAEESEDGPLQEVIRTNLAGWLGQAHALRQVHRGPGGVTCGAFSADGKRFALGYQSAEGEKTKVQVYDSATGKPVGPLLEHQGDVHFVGFGPDGKTLVTGDVNWHRFLRWDLTTNRALGQPFAEEKGWQTAALSPDGKLLAVGDQAGLVRLWDVDRQRMVRSLAHDKASVKEVAFSSDGKTLRTFTNRLGVVGGDAPLPPSSVYSWDVATGRRIGQVSLRAGEEAFRFGPAGTTVLTVDDDSMARVRNGETGRIIGSPMALSGKLESARFAPDGRMILLTDGSGACEWWDGALGQPVVGALPAGGAVLAFSPCGKFVLRKGGVLWEVARAPSRPLFRSSRKTSRGGFAGWAAYSPDRRSALVGDNRGVVRLVDAATGRPRGVPLRVPWRVSALAFSPDGKRFAVASHDLPFGEGGSMATVCYLCDSSTGRPICPPLPHVNWVSTLSFSPDGKVLATGGFDHAVHLWEAATGKRIGRPMLQKSIVLFLGFSPDGKTLAVQHSHEQCGYVGIDLVDVAAWKTRLSLKDWITGKPCFSPDSKVLAIRHESPSAPEATRLWDTTTGRQIGKELDDNSGVGCSPVFSTDGRWVLTGGRVGHLWEAATGKPVGPPLPQPGFVTAVAFSPDRDSLLLIGSGDGTARLWDRATYKPLGPPVSLTAHAAHAAFLPDGRSFVTTGADGQVRQWPAVGALAGSVEQLRLRLQVRTGLTMSPLQAVIGLSFEEWQKVRDQLAAGEGSLRGDNADFVDEPTWHDLRAREAAAENAWFTALWHLDRLIGLEANSPQKWRLFARRARAELLSGHLDKAAGDDATARKLGPRAEVLDWYRHCVADCDVSGQKDAMLWYLERGLAAAPEDRDFLLQLAEARARHGDWKQSAALYERYSMNGPVAVPICYHQALVCLRAGDQAGYGQVCARLLKTLPGRGVPIDANTANTIAMLCAVGPDAVSDFSQPLALIESALTALNNIKAQPGAEGELRKVRHAWLNTQGALLYRAGRHLMAVRLLENAVAIHGAGVAEDWLFLALCHHRLDRAEEARRWLDKARAVKPFGEDRRFWEDLEMDVLRREAEAVTTRAPSGGSQI